MQSIKFIHLRFMLPRHPVSIFIYGECYTVMSQLFAYIQDIVTLYNPQSSIGMAQVVNPDGSRGYLFDDPSF